MTDSRSTRACANQHRPLTMTPDEAEGLLSKMNESGLSWLTPILRSMLGGDPFQEGAFAKEIVGTWAQSGHAEDVNVKHDALDAYARQNADLHRENLLLRDENVELRRQVQKEWNEN